MSNDSSSEGNITNNPKLKRVPKIPEDRYKILEVLGAGGMGVVLKATHVQLNKPVAIKVLNTTNLLDDTSIQRFELEAQAGSQLTHPNLISVFDYGTTEDGEPFLVMEYVEGKSLWDLVSDEGTLKIEKFFPIFKQIAKAVQFIHKNNIIHRDIKTSNIMIQVIDDDIYAKLLDFGIAKVMEDSGLSASELTATGNVFGSPLYMSPENCMGRPLDNRSDIYSFGCVMYECVSGAPPLIGENVMQTIQKQISELPEKLSSLKSSNPSERSLARVIHKCIEKDPSLRYSTMAEVIQDLSAAAEEANLSSQALSILQPSSPSMKRWTQTESKIPAQTKASQEKTETDIPAQNKAKRANLVTSENLFDTQVDGISPVSAEPGSVNSTIDSRPEALAETDLQQSTIDKLGKLEKIQSKKKPDPGKNLPTWSSPEIIALACLFFVAGLVFTNPFFKNYYQDIAAKQNLEQAENLFLEGKKRWVEAEPLYLKALDGVTTRGDKGVMGVINCRLGRINYNQGKILKANDYYLKSLELLEPIKDDHKAAYLESVIGKANCLSRQKQYKKTEKVLNQAREIAEKWEFGPMKVGDILMLAAENYSTSRKRVKHAISFYDHAIKEYSKLEDKPNEKLAFAWIESAELSSQMRWWPDANHRVEQALKLVPKITVEPKRNEVTSRAQEIKNEFEQTNKKPASKSSLPKTSLESNQPKNRETIKTTESAIQQSGLIEGARRFLSPRERRILHRERRFRQANPPRFNPNFSR